MSGQPKVQETTSALEPKLTKWDQRVLAKLDDWTKDRILNDRPLQWRDAWQVARELREYDVKLVRQTLDALVDFRYAMAVEHGHKRRWVHASWRREDG